MLSSKHLSQILEGVYFVLASLLAFYGLYILTADLQDFSHTFKMLPLYLCFLEAIYLLFILHLLFHPLSFKKLKKTYCVNGLVLAGLSFLSALLFLVAILMGKIHGFVQGVISPLYPLDFILLDLFFIALGIFFFLKGRKLRDEGIVYETYSHGKVAKGFLSFFRSVYVLIALYCLGAFLWGLGMAAYGSDYQGYLLVVYLLMLLPSAFLAYYEFYYRERKTSLSPKKKKISAFVALGVSAFLSILFFIFLALHPDLLIEDMTAYFPLDFQGSVSIAPFLLTLSSLAVSAVALFESYRKEKAQ
jgi:hypothetical protein